jgi:hypothetical protein
MGYPHCLVCALFIITKNANHKVRYMQQQQKWGAQYGYDVLILPKEGVSSLTCIYRVPSLHRN